MWMERGKAFLHRASVRRWGILLLLCIPIVFLADLGIGAIVPRSNTPQISTLHPPAQVGSPTCANASQAANPIVAENTCPGTTAWYAQHNPNQPAKIEGYAVPASVNVGGTITLYVNTKAPTYTFNVYRLGWYGGAGGHLLYTSPPLAGVVQPEPLYLKATHTVDASNWRKPIAVAIPPTWVSGVYIAQFISSGGATNNTLFVVRNDASRAPIAAVVPLSTYEAYNAWGGTSLYDSDDGTPGVNDRDMRSYMVTFDRPYDGSAGLGNFVRWDINAIHFLEREGYNVAYLADIDLDAHPSSALHHRLLIDTGHSEYWSEGMRKTAEQARDAGVSLAFWSANNMYWQTRLAPSPLGADRRVYCYRYASLDPLTDKQPALTTVQWRQPPANNPEQNLLGEMYAGITTMASTPLVLTPDAQFLLAGTGLQPGDQLPGLVGQEYDHVWSSFPVPATVTKLGNSQVSCTPGQDVCGSDGHAESDATLYTYTSGARVFAAGTFQWSWGLDDWGAGTIYRHTSAYANAGFQKFNENLIAYLLHQPLPNA